jgi:hypothetical protein
MIEPESSVTPDPSGGPTSDAPRGAPKRRGLTLPPRGQALTRLQDLERDEPLPSPTLGTFPTASSSAVGTASSNSGDTAISSAVLTAPSIAVTEASQSSSLTAATPSLPPAKQAQPVREPTTRITVDMPNSLHRRVSILSVETRRSIKDLVLEALEAHYFRTPDSGRTEN